MASPRMLNMLGTTALEKAQRLCMYVCIYNMYMYICICIYVYVYVDVDVHVYTCASTICATYHTQICVSLHAFTHSYMHLHAIIHIYRYLYIYLHICMLVCICT